MKRNLLISITKILGCIILFSGIQCNKIEDPFYQYSLAIEKIAPTGGNAGTEVTITGTGFSTVLNENKVQFNGKEATVSKATATSLIVKAPADGSTGKVTVTVNHITAEGPVFTYLAPDQPMISSISPDVGWDYTLNSVTINGKNFGNDQQKAVVTFDGTSASIQSFSDTKIIVSPPTHEAGKVDVVVKAGTVSSNAVRYTYQIKPVIRSIYLDEWGDHTNYFIAVDHMSSNNIDVTITINGHPASADYFFRKGTDQYQTEPAGDKVATRFYVDNEIGYVSIMDFVVTSNGMSSAPYRFINTPKIDQIRSKDDADNLIRPGDTVVIDGRYLGKKNQTSKIELWDSTGQIHLTPDPAILSWDEDEITIDLPADYNVPAGKSFLRLHLEENGRATDGAFYYMKTCPALAEVYTGYYQYPNQSKQPYGIQFFADGTMDFSSSYDDYAGIYTFDCTTNEVTLDFAGHGVIVKAIRQNNALTNFHFIKSTGFSFLDANLNTTWNQNLDGTKWNLQPPQINSTVMSFASGNKVSFDQSQNPSTYTRLAGTIRFTIDAVKYFATITQKTMQGENSNFQTWSAEKQ